MKSLCHLDRRISSGYLVDQNLEPGGGGLMLFEAESYQEAKNIVLQDPMITEELVEWNLQQWLPVEGNVI